MIGFSRRVSVACLVSLTMAACATGEHLPSGKAAPNGTLRVDPTAGTDESALSLDPGKVGKALDPNEPELPGGIDDPGMDNSDFPDDSADEPNAPTCACDIALPGVDIDLGGGKLKISVELPKQNPIVIEVSRGGGQTYDGGLVVTGDLDLDLGGGQIVSLIDADLQLEIGEKNGLMLNADAALMVGLDAHALPLSADVIDLEAVHLALETGDCRCHKLVKITGNVAADAGGIWAPPLPVQAASELDATVWMADGELTRMALTGDVNLGLDILRCDQSLLHAAALVGANIELNPTSMIVEGRVDTAIDSRFSLLGDAKITATFSDRVGGWSPLSSDWSIKLCDGKLTGPLLGLVQNLDCLNLDISGAKSCQD